MTSDQPQLDPSVHATEAKIESPLGSDAPQTTYGQILKSSAWIGGSSVLAIGIGIVRTKAMAVMLGPSGFGLMGLYGSIIDLALAAASMGIGNAGVRQIAESVASSDKARIARTVVVLRRAAVVLGLLGAALLVAFSSPLSTLTFGSDQHAGAVTLLSLAVFFRLVTSGQGALIQGMRRIHDLAVVGVAGAFLGAFFSIVLVYLYREQGVAPSLVASAAMGLIISWWYARRVEIQLPELTPAELTQEAGSLLKLGFAFMVSGLLMMGAAYAVRATVLRMEGFEAAGFYTAAWTLGGLYVSIILQAMGADFYPRLVGVADDDRGCNRLVNEQTLVSLLLAGPGVIATIIFAPVIIALFYSAEFDQAVEILRWICLGIALRVISWPMGFIIVAKNRQIAFIGTEVAWTVVNVSLTWICLKSFGLNGAGIAFFGSYVFHLLLIYPIVRRLSGFGFSRENTRIVLLFISLIAIVFCGLYVFGTFWAYSFGSLTVLLTSIYSLRTLLSLVGKDKLPKAIRQLSSILNLRFAASDSK